MVTIESSDSDGTDMSTPFIDLGLFCGMGAEEGADLFYRLDNWKLQAFVLKYSDPSTAENAWRPRARYNEYLTSCCQPHDGPDATLHDSDNQATDDEPASGYISLHGCRTDDGPHSRNGKVANPVTADVSISRLIFVGPSCWKSSARYKLSGRPTSSTY